MATPEQLVHASAWPASLGSMAYSPRSSAWDRDWAHCRATSKSADPLVSSTVCFKLMETGY